ncbi:LPS assembly lipoprotein LptE [Fulvimonas yonginensis]|uniref:LPS-assembly lipoprotein LptE n=1 Tax=Fulvimonas yonginensis TaxID=1495200 RepID=A0ABU8JDU5_9GAMM
MNRLLRAPLLAAVLVLSACGFHLRQSAALPASMQRMHLSVNGGGDLQRNLARALESSGVTLEDEGGPGIAELKIPVAQFSTDMLSVSGGARVTEYAVNYQVRFEVDDGAGQPLVPQQRIDMSRSYSYDARNTVGNEAQVEEIRRSLNDDMVQAILFRLQAAAQHPQAAPAAASSAG